MGYYVGNDYTDIRSVSDYGSRKLLNVDSLSNYINYGNSSRYPVLNDCYSFKSRNNKLKRRANFSNFLRKLPAIMTVGITGACLIKTGYIKKIPQKIGSIFSLVAKLFNRN